MSEAISGVNPKIRYASGLQCYFYTMFITQKKYRFDEVSKKMGIAEDTLRAYASGELPISVSRFLDFMKATDDLDYLKFMADEMGCRLRPKLDDRYEILIDSIINGVKAISGDGSKK